MVADVGVAGIHRLLGRIDELQGADVLICVAGMEAALPSVVGGLTDCPIIGVPTSVGYGAHFGGLASLLGMLNSCSSNVVVVNIDAGFNGGHVAALIARRAALARLGREPSAGIGLRRAADPARPGHRTARRTRTARMTRRIRQFDPRPFKTSGRQPQGDVRPRPCDRRRSRDGRRRRPGRGLGACDRGPAWSAIASPSEVAPTVATFEPSYMTYPLASGRRRPDRLPRGSPVPHQADRPGRRPRRRAGTGAVGGASRDAPMARRGGRHARRPRCRRPEQSGRSSRGCSRA